MARRAVTRIGGDEAQRAAAERAAMASGGAARQRARQMDLDAQRQQQQQAAQTAQIAGQAGARADEQILRREQMEQQGEQFEKRLKLDEFRAGAERVPSDRESRLAQDMERGAQQTQGLYGPPLPPDQQQNIRDQAGRGMQTDDGYTYRPREDVREAQQAESERKAYQAQTERMRVRAYQQQTAIALRKARAAGDTEAVEQTFDKLVKPLRSNIDRIDRMMTGNLKDGDWRETKNIVSREANPERHQDVIEDARNERWTPRLQKFMQAEVAKRGIETILLSEGAFPVSKDGTPLMDMDSPVWQAFMTAREEQAQKMKILAGTNPGFTSFYGLTSLDSKTRALNIIAAGMVETGAVRVGDPMAGQQPSTLPQQQGPAVPQQTQEEYDAEVGRYDPPMRTGAQARWDQLEPETQPPQPEQPPPQTYNALPPDSPYHRGQFR